VASLEVRDAEPAEAIAFLAALQAASGIPPVDEDEQRRLAGLPPVRDPDWDWAGHLVALDGAPVVYAGIRMPADRDGRCAARVDLAVDRAHPQGERALAAALEHPRSHAGTHADPHAGTYAGTVQAWLRGATDADLAVAAQAGFTVRERLHVLAADAATLRERVPGAPRVDEGLRLRAFDPDAPEDTAAVVRLLTRAYPELDGWYSAGFAVLRGSAWFRAEDLLLLEGTEGAALLAVHWMKRRDGEVGEVYNLAVDPDAQGRGLGPVMLDTGLAHLVASGCREVILWVDAANPRALALYRSRGFAPRWDDVSLTG